MPLISRNEALERLRECRTIAETDPEGANEMAISVLLEIIEDEHISFSFRMVLGIGSNPLEVMPKQMAPEDNPRITATEIKRRMEEPI